MAEKSTPRLWRLLKPNVMALNVQRNTKEGAIEELIELLTETKHIDEKTKILEKVLEREKMISTGIGEGVAIPHAKYEQISAPIFAFGRSEEGVTFESLDGKKVHLIFLLLYPKDEPVGYVKILGKTARLLDSRDLREALKSAQTPQDIINLIKEAEKKLL